MLAIRKKTVKLALAATVGALILSPVRPALAGWLDGVKEIKIGDKTYPVCPDEYLIKAGLPVSEVPDDQNAAIEYIKAINLFMEEPEKLRKVYDYVLGNTWVEEAKSLLPWLDENGPAILAVREGAKKKDCKFPFLKKPEESFFMMLLPHLSKMRTLARLLVIQGKYLEYQGKYREALDDYLIVARMSYHVSRGPILISGLVGIACDAIAVKAIESCMLRNRLDTATLTYLRQRIDMVGRAAQSFKGAMVGERVGGLQMVDDLFERPRELYEAFGDSAGKGAKVGQLLVLLPSKPLGIRAIMKSDLRRYWKEMDKWVELPDYLAFRPENRVDQKVLEELPPWSLGKMLLPALSHARSSFVAAKARKAILTTEIALEIYWDKNLDYPQSLEQLKGILDEIPIDPFTNEPLKYKLTQDGYVVYSVGENLVDDGGEGDTGGRKKDIVGRCPLPETEPAN